MSSMILVFPKIEDAKSIRNLLVRQGFQVAAVCSSGAQALSSIDMLNDGIVICGYRFHDMLYSQLLECLPSGFEMLLLASPRILSENVDKSVVCVAMPLKVHELIATINMMLSSHIKKRKKHRDRAKERNPRDQAHIEKAKTLLMERNHLSEEEAHRYIQKCSMDSGNTMVETAQMITTIMG